MAENTNTEQWALEELGFYLDERDGVWVVFDDGEEATPANLTERVLWDALKKARASLSLPAAGQEPVAHLWQHGETGRTRIVLPDMIVDADASWQVVGPLYLGAAPQPAVAAGWIASAEQMPPPGERVFWMDKDSRMVGYDTWMGEDFRWTASHWMRIPPAPSTEGESR